MLFTYRTLSLSGITSSEWAGRRRGDNLLPTPIDILGYVLSWTHISLCTVKMLVVENSNSPITCNMFFLVYCMAFKRRLYSVCTDSGSHLLN